MKRTSEIEEFTNLHLIHPISSWLVPKLAALKITPNMVSLTGMMFGILGGVAYNHYDMPYMIFVGFLSMVLWHIMDGADGQLARLTNSHSELGMILDGVCDYVTFISLYIGLGLALSYQGYSGIWYLVFAAGILHAIQSSAYELQRKEYDYWGYGKKSAELPEIKDMIEQLKGKNFLSFMMSQLHIIYIRMQRSSSGINLDFRKSLKDALDNNPDKETEIHSLYREIFAPVIKHWSIMCANYRTIAVFVACIIGLPSAFFWFEIAILTPILIILVQKQRVSNQLFLLRLKEIA